MCTKEKILITDDSALNRQLLADILGDRYEYLYAGDGVEALELLNSRFDIDLLLLDINMPRLDGFSVLSALKHCDLGRELPVIIISSEDDDGFIQRAYDLGVTDYLQRPFNVTVVQRRVSNTLAMYARQRQLVHLAEEQVYQREKTNSAIISILSHVVESKNRESGTHILHVRTITSLMLRQLVSITDRYPLSQEDISRISTFSALHDIGKIKIPDEILNKPGKLTNEEFEIMKRHSVIGDELLRDMPVPQDDPLMRTAHEICRWHHERWDGRGYPDGLKGDEIPISAQVVALADVYDALTSDRCYKPAFTHEAAISMILNGECGAFNPLLLDCLTAVQDRLRTAMERAPSLFDYQEESHRLAEEMLDKEPESDEDPAWQQLPLEQAKAAFFAQQCGGLQFVHDRWTDVVTYTDWSAPGAPRHWSFSMTDQAKDSPLTHEDQVRLYHLVRAATPASPDLSMEVSITVGGETRSALLRARVIWSPGSVVHACLVGRFSLPPPPPRPVKIDPTPLPPSPGAESKPIHGPYQGPNRPAAGYPRRQPGEHPAGPQQ